MLCRLCKVKGVNVWTLQNEGCKCVDLFAKEGCKMMGGVMCYMQLLHRGNQHREMSVFLTTGEGA